MNDRECRYIYDPQPESEEGVQAWVDAYVANDPSTRPHWEFDVEEDFMPDGWITDFVEDGDEHFGLDFYTIIPYVPPVTDGNIWVTDGPDSGANVFNNNPFLDLDSAISYINDNVGNHDGTYYIWVSEGTRLSEIGFITYQNGVTIMTNPNESDIAVITTELIEKSHNDARHFKVDEKATLTLAKITLDGQGVGGGVWVNGGTLNMEAKTTIKNCIVDDATANGGAVYVSDGGIFNMSGGLIHGNRSLYSGGGVYVVGSSTFNMSDGTIRNNKTTSSVDITTEAGATEAGIDKLANGGGVAIIGSFFNMNGEGDEPFDDAGNPKIIYNSATHIGGGVHVDDESIVYMHDGAEISHNTTNTWDGGILIHWKSKFFMYGGKISNNTSVFNGGGVGIISSDFVMRGGEISGNKTTDTGGNATGGGIMVGKSDIRGEDVEGTNGTTTEMYTIPGTFKMYGGKISGNHAVNSGGGVSIEDASTFEMFGGDIVDNTTDDAGGGVNVQGSSTFTMTGGNIKNNESNFTGGGVFVIDTRREDKLGITDDDDEIDPSTFNMSGGLIENNSATYGSPLTEDEAALAGVDGLAAGGGVAIVRSVFNMNGDAVINDNHAKHIGGGVFAHDKSEVTMTGNAVISNNDTETWDGGILIHWKSTFIMDGESKIINNESVFNGGGVGIISSDFKMKNGLIAGNQTTATDEKGIATGGGVMIGKSDIMGDVNLPSTFTMSGGQITGNYAVDAGGGVSIEDGSEFTMIEGTIGGEFPKDDDGYLFTPITYEHKNTDGTTTPITITIGNRTNQQGGGVNIQQGSTFTMSGGSVSENSSYLSGGGVYVVDGSTFNMKGSALVDNNQTISNADIATEEGAKQAEIEGLANGGGVAIISSTFNMNGNEEGPFSKEPNNLGNPAVDNNFAQHIGGGVHVDDNSTVYMYPGAVISNNETKTWDGGILIHWESEFYMYGGKIINNTSVFNGGGVGIISSDFEMSGGLIAGNQTTSTKDSTGGGVMVGKSDIRGEEVVGDNGTTITKMYTIPGTFKMTGGTITGNKAIMSGGGVSIEDGSTFDMSGNATIGGAVPEGVTPKTNITSGNYTTERAGGVYLQAGSTFTMDGNAAISDNYAENTGGGVYVTSITNTMYSNNEVSTFTMNGGSITGNKTNESSGGVAVHQSYFYMNGGEIKNNTSKLQGGGVGVGSSVFEMTGGTISGNWTSWIYIRLKVTDNPTTYEYITGTVDKSGQIKDAEGNIITLTTNHTIMDGAGAGGVWVTKSSSYSSTVPAPSVIGNSGVSYFNMSGTSEISGNTAANTGGGVNVQSGSKFTMNDGKIDANYATSYGAGVYVKVENTDTVYFSTFDMNGGTISSNQTTAAGGGVYLTGYSTAKRVQFTMTGGSIKSNGTGNNGGGVYLNYSDLDMSGGDITSNRTTVVSVEDDEEKIIATGSGGGGVYANNYSKITMSNTATISSNTASSMGGGVYLNTRSEITMSGEANISNNISRAQSAGICASSYSKITMEGGKVFGNTSSNNAGGIYLLSNSTMTMKGGEISGNKGVNGAGINVNGGSLYLYGGDIISNTASGMGGGVHISRSGGANNSIFEMTGGNIEGNSSTNNHGGGVSVERDFTMSGGTIKGNTAKNYGGGVYVTSNTSYSATFNMTGDATISGNTATAFGGGVYVVGTDPTVTTTTTEATFNMGGGATISGNTATTSGGGVYVTSGGKLDITGGAISSNTANGTSAGAGGGGVFVNGTTAATAGTFTMTNAAISGNTATSQHGGGVYVAANGTLTTIGTSSIIGNNAPKGDGGGIYTTDYSRLTTSADTVFRGNTASKLRIPPDYVTNNADTAYPNIDYASISVPGVFRPNATPDSKEYQYHPLNNYDINYAAGTEYTEYVVIVQNDGNGTASASKGNATTNDNGFITVSNAELPKTITLEATPNKGYRFKEWQVISGNVTLISSNTSSYNTFNMPSSNVTVKAIFEEINFEFTKVDAANYETPLPGAEFQLYYEEDDETYYYSEDNNGNVTWLKQSDDGEPTTISSGEDGKVIFRKLKSDTTYHLVETKAPEGYQLPTGYWEVIVDSVGNVSIGDFKPTGTGGVLGPAVPGGEEFLIGNMKNFELPASGSDGIQWFILLGILLLASGTARIIYNERKKRQNAPSELEKQ